MAGSLLGLPHPATGPLSGRLEVIVPDNADRVNETLAFGGSQEHWPVATEVATQATRLSRTEPELQT
jgi:hypothetical protein